MKRKQSVVLLRDDEGLWGKTAERTIAFNHSLPLLSSCYVQTTVLGLLHVLTLFPHKCVAKRIIIIRWGQRGTDRLRILLKFLIYVAKLEFEPSYPVIGELPGGFVVKNWPANAGDSGSIPGLGRCPGEGNGNSLQYSCLGNLMDKGAWWVTGRGVAKSKTWLSD